MKPLEKSNLPTSDVKLVAVSEAASALVEFLSDHGIEVVKILPSSKISDGTASHADLHLLHCGENILWISREQSEKAELLKSYGFDVNLLSVLLEDEYPLDVPLNAAVVGQTVFLNPKTICKDINFAKKKIIPVRQGYSKCSVCVAGENAVITDDVGMYEAALKNGMGALLVEKGDVKLRGRDYGFIGGCCGMINSKTMLFNGNLDSHRNVKAIKDFLKKHGIDCLSYGDYPLTDIGGIIPLCEE